MVSAGDGFSTQRKGVVNRGASLGFRESALERFEFDATTSAGRFDARLQRGTLAVVSGRIAKQSPQAMTVRTPAAVLGVRGTEFVVSADE